MSEIRFTTIPNARDRTHRKDVVMSATEFAAALDRPVSVVDKESRPAASWGVHRQGRIEQSTLESVTAILLDFDSKNNVSPTFEEAVKDCDRLDFAAFLHTSYSHDPERPAYRVIVPLKGNLEPRLNPPATRLLMHLLPNTGSYNDPASVGIGRLFFLPCVHPDRVQDYRAWSGAEKLLLDAQELAGMAEKLMAAEKAKEQARLAKEKKPFPLLARNTEASLIEQFNSKVTFQQLFAAASYREVKPGRWLSPHSRSGQAGITLNRETNRIYCGHESDGLFSPGHAHDPFSVYCVLWHGGDVRKALAALRKGRAVA
ncbi:hypothetical protein HAP99_10075 [Acidithiobacillus caldus]|uniref:hypothetical protein n=1 Tax=Acidithiobacillus caldus TaxID=33059 RepID=UPI001C071F23|nr:hypothetical protein [Acidithiobacillus caldus]MBU2783516.1 hypothetical protein [Acidithiobacillus caldus]